MKRDLFGGEVCGGVVFVCLKIEKVLGRAIERIIKMWNLVVSDLVRYKTAVLRVK